jgi:hypothetical protein
LGAEQRAAALMGGTERGLARSGQTAGTLAMVERETGRDVFELQRNLQLQIADLQDRARMRAEARASGFGDGGVLRFGPSFGTRRSRTTYVGGLAAWDRPKEPRPGWGSYSGKSSGSSDKWGLAGAFSSKPSGGSNWSGRLAGAFSSKPSGGSNWSGRLAGAFG